MSVEIHVKPEDAWGYFSHVKDILSESQIEIARNESTDTSVCITIENGFPLFNVYRRGGKLYSEPAVKEDCFGTLRNIYIKYLFPIVVGQNASSSVKDKPAKAEEPEEDYVSADGVVKRAAGGRGPQDLEDEMYQREDELEMAVSDALDAFTGADVEAMFGRDSQYVLQSMVNDICEYLAKNYGVSIYRPMWVEDEGDDQTFVYTEFPYDALAETEETEEED